MIHRPKSIEDLLGRIEIMVKLYEAWNDLTRLQNKTLKIFKEDWGMDRFRENQINRIKKHIPAMKHYLEQIINLYKKDIKAMIKK